MNIVTTNYDHATLKKQFSQDMLCSLNYLREFAEILPTDRFYLHWKTAAAHYLAIKFAENGDLDRLRFFLDYIESHKKRDGINIIPLFEDTSLETEMILEIIKDDNQLGFGFCQKNDYELIEQEIRKINTALNEIKKYDINSSNEINEYIDSIYLTREGKDGERFMRSGTNFYMWGMMFIYIKSTHSIPYYIDHIIHECAHTALNIFNAKDELVTNASTERFTAPLRKDKRPMIGLFHALFVLNRICGTFKKIISDESCEYLDEAIEKYNDSLKKLQDTYTTVRANAKTTPLGENILNSIKMEWGLV